MSVDPTAPLCLHRATSLQEAARIAVARVARLPRVRGVIVAVDDRHVGETFVLAGHGTFLDAEQGCAEVPGPAVERLGAEHVARTWSTWRAVVSPSDVLVVHAEYEPGTAIRLDEQLRLDLGATFGRLLAQSRATHQQRVLVQVLGDLVERRDPHTGEHVRRVGRLTEEICLQLRADGLYTDVLDDQVVSVVGAASALHDLGKLGVPDRVLLKAGPLDEEEREVIRRHPIYGGELLSQAIAQIDDRNPYLSIARDIALGHHEHHDGAGYPAALSGEEIPVVARVVALADVYDALTSERPYKPAWSEARAWAYVESRAGTQFDPAVVAALGAVLERRRKVLPLPAADMSIGDPTIDAEHARFLELVERVLLSGEGTSLGLGCTLQDLTRYAEVHFRHEEGFMEALGYPGLTSHRDEHRSFLRTVRRLRWRYEHGMTDHLPTCTRVLLTRWVGAHLAGEDRHIARWAEELPIPLTDRTVFARTGP